MISEVNDDFVDCYRRLPERIRRQARRSHRLWKKDPSHPSLDFKLVSRRSNVWSVRVGIGWRSLGVRAATKIIWFWIGSHAEYDRVLRGL